MELPGLNPRLPAEEVGMNKNCVFRKTYRNKIIRFIARTAILAVVFTQSLPLAGAYWMWSPDSGKFVSSESSYQGQADEMLKYALDFGKTDENRAISELENLIRQFPTSDAAPEAQYKIGLFYEKRGNETKAFEAYKRLTENYPQNARADSAMDNLYHIGELFLSGGKDKVAGIALVPRLPKAVEVFQHIVETAPYGPYGDRAQFQIGVANQRMNRSRRAMQAFQKVIDYYPSSRLVDDAYFQLAESAYAFSKRASRDQHALEKADQVITDYLSRYPDKAASDQVRQLKQEIKTQDAKKNFEIAQYYENEKARESAKLYYQDVARNYPDTVYGKEAVQKLKSLEAEIKVIQKNWQEIDSELKSIEGKIKTLDEKRDRLLSGKASAGTLADEKKRLEESKRYLKDQRRRLKQNLTEREKTYKFDEKTWREKRKIFESKQRDMRDNHAPELARAFASWEQSLLDEKKRLDEERDQVLFLRRQFIPSAGKKKGFHLPWFGRRGKPIDQLLSFRAPQLQRVHAERLALAKNIRSTEKTLAEVISGLYELDRKHFEAAGGARPSEGLIQTPTGAPPKTAEKELAGRKAELDILRQTYDQKKADYKKKYGELFLADIVKQEALSRFPHIQEKIESGTDPDELLRQLQDEKLQTSESLEMHQRMAETLSHAFGRQPAEETLAEASSVAGRPAALEEEIQPLTRETVLGRRALKKRIKALEREIRKRFDEIEDWNTQKRENIRQLAELIQVRRTSVFGKASDFLLQPVRFFYWLTRSLAFGLADHDRLIMREAKAEAKSKNPDQAVKILRLHDTIQTQSLFIQGRFIELETMKSQLEVLRRKSDQLGYPVMLPIFINQESDLLNESVRSAQDLLPAAGHEAVLIEKLNQETQKLERDGTKLAKLDRQIAEVIAYQHILKELENAKVKMIKEAAQKREQEEQLEAVPEAENETKVPVKVSAEKTAVSTTSVGIKTEVISKADREAERLKAEAELKRLKSQIDAGKKAYAAEKKAAENKRFEQYRKQQENLRESASAEPVQSPDTRFTLGRKRRFLEQSLIEMKKKWERLLNAEEKILNEKRTRLAKRIKKEKNRLNNPDFQSLREEFERVEAERADIHHALSSPAA